MKILEVSNRKSWKLFHQAPHRVYAGDPNWISPLEQDIYAVLSPQYNKSFSDGAGKCFVLLDDQGRPAGRIAAFIDFNLEKKVGYRAGGIGFFECIDKEEYAAAIFQVAEQYLRQYDVQAIDGPINFGERDKFWGLLVRGAAPPLYQENYHPDYYRSFFENQGFQPYEQILTLRGKISDIPIDRLRAIAQRAYRRYPFTVELLDLKNIGKYTRDFAAVYNASFQHSPFFKPIDPEAVLRIFQIAKPIIDPKIISFAYYEDRPAGFCILFPEVNPFFKPLKGKMNILKGLQFLYNLRRAKKKDIKGVAFGIHPDFHKKGVYSLLVQKLYDTPGLTEQYQYINLATIRSYNDIMIKSTANLGVQVDRIHYTYRKVVDPSFKFEPFEFIPEEELFNDSTDKTA